MKIEIKSRLNALVLFSVEAGSVKSALEIAVKSGANLSGADLSGADLYRADLSRANLYGVDLSRANLSRADLSEAILYGANLSKTDLSRIDLSGTDLSEADLSRANLSEAVLYCANLSEANLYRANLSGANLSGANLYRANLSEVNLSKANLSGANLSGTNLSGANLYRANLSEVNLSKANLSGADLYGVDLSSTNLSGVGSINKYRCTPLLMLLDQPGKIRAYKLVTSDLEGPYNGGIKYIKDTILSVENADCDETKQCAAGISLATLDWCIREWQPGYQILVAEFEADDIAAIPTATDGKFRVHRCVIVGEKDLAEIRFVGENHNIDPPG